MKKELFLTSSVHAVAHDIASKLNLSENNKLVFIDTPAEPDKGEKEWLKNDRQALVDAGFIVTDYTITNKTREQVKTDLDKFDYIYLSGGNTGYLLQQSQKSGFVSLIREFVETKGKIYIGTSAGSIMAGPELPDYYPGEDAELEDRECYNLVNFTIMPHWGSGHFKDKYLKERLEAAYREDQGSFVILTDNQYVHIIDEQMEIIDVKK